MNPIKFILAALRSAGVFGLHLGGESGGSAPASQTQVSDLPDWAKPYAKETLGKAQALTDVNQNPFQTFGGQRVAGATPLQEQSYASARGMGTSDQINQATQAAQQAVASAQGMGYNPAQFANQYNAPNQYQAGDFGNQFVAPRAYQEGSFTAQQVDPNTAALQKYQMGPAERVGTGSFVDPGVAGSYMSPYIQQVMDVEKREAGRQSAIQQQANQAQAVGQGAFGGSRSAIVEAERQRNLGQQMGDIQTRGLQAAFDRAGQLYGTDAARQLQAAQANQQAGMNVGAQNLQALLGVQQLGASQGLQAQLANQQAGMEAQRMREQSRQFGAGQGLSAAQLQAQYGLSAQQAAEASRQFGSQQDMMARQLQAQYGMSAQQAQEASRQFGANLGMQGLSSQLQGAQLLGSLGGQQFGQQMDISRLQNLYGGQQQQLQQQQLAQQYQDFMNQQRYPYQQLEFMSNILRGTPMGTVSTLYGGQPNMMGQLAGLGMGMYGAFGRAGGGMVSSYAEGGSVTSDENVEGILSKLSDQQLQQAKQIAMAQRDAERVQMIDAELAERASMKQGLGAAFNQIPQAQQDAVTQMAGGGIVAFAGDERYNDPLFGQLVSGEFDVGNPEENAGPGPLTRLGNLLSGRTARGGKSIEEYYNEAPSPTPGVPRMSAAQPETQTYTRTGGAPAPADRPVAVAAAPAKSKSKAPASSITAAANAVANAAEQTAGVKRTGMKQAVEEGLALLKDTQGEADSKRMVELINRISKSEAPNKMDMLANFGFRMAAAASKPGARFLSAAAEGAQVIPEMRAQAGKEAKEAQRLGATLEMEKLKLDAANRRGNRQEALRHAQNIRIMEGQEAQLGLTGQQLAETKRANIARERLQGEQIAASKQRSAAQQGRMEAQMLATRRSNAQKALTQASKDWNEDITRKGVRSQYPSLQAYQAALFKDLQLQSLPQLRLLSDED